MQLDDESLAPGLRARMKTRCLAKKPGHPENRWWLVALVCLTLGSSLTSTSPAWAQSFVIRTFTGADGLPSDTIRTVAQGPHRRLWIATRSGLSVYDGTTFETVVLPATPQPDLGFVEVAADGTLVAVSQLLPLDLFVSPDGSEWTRVEGPRDSQMTGNLHVTGLAIANREDSRFVAVAIEGGGLAIYDGLDWSVLSMDDFEGARLLDVEALDDAFLVATSIGVFRVEGTSKPEKLAVANGRNVVALLNRPARPPAEANRVYILADDWIGYLESGREETISDEVRLPRIAGSIDTGGCIAVDTLGGIYFGMQTGLFYFDPAHRTVHSIGTANGLAADGVNEFVFDDEQNLWIGSARGLEKISSRRFATWRQTHGLLEDEVSAIAELEPGRLVFGHNRGLSFLEKGEIRTVDFGREGVAAGGTRIMEIAPGAAGTFWLAGVESGLGRMNVDGRVQWIRGAGLPPIVVSLRADRDRLLVVGGGYLYQGDLDATSFTKVDVDPRVGPLRRIALGSDGTIYVMGESGLAFGSTRSWTFVDAADNRNASNVYSVLPETPDGRVWVGTLDGLYAIEGTRLVRVFAGGSSIGQPVYFILRESLDRTWIGTNDGVFLLDGRELRHFSVRQGLAGRETNRAAAIVDHAGAVWIGTDRGVSRYERRFDRGSAPPPTLELLTVDAGKAAFSLLEDSTFPSDENDLSFHFRGVSFADERVLYRYLLEGFDTDWGEPVPVETGHLDFRNLSPGRYRLHLMAGTSAGTWSEAVTSAMVVVRPPFWRTAWFAGLVAGGIALAAFLVFAIFWSRHRQAHFDPLTQLPNRESFFRRLEREFEANLGTSQQFAVLILDLDHFRFVTNSLGHDAGDKLLIRIGERLRQSVRHGSFIARLGSDEFAVLLRNVRDPEHVIATAEEIRASLSQHFEIDGQEIFSSASIGVAIGPENYRWASNLLRDADTAMHGAKSRGLGGIEVFDRTMHSRTLGLLRLESDLRRAIERREFRVHYQPIVSMDDLRVLSVEALLRWEHPVAGLIGPDEFLQVAEETGLILEIGDVVLEESCRQLHEWKEGLFRDHPLTVHVNISPRQFENPSLARRLAAILDANGLAPADVVLEITEASVVGKSATSVRLLRELRDLGAPLCIDDFGAGHSSLSYVRDLPVQCIKLDRSFISNGILRQAREIIDTILALARTLNLPVIAEGVETEDDYRQLREAGCQAAQGYLFSKAVPGTAITPRIELGLSPSQGSGSSSA